MSLPYRRERTPRRSGTGPSYGCSSSPNTWLPMPEGWGGLTAEAQAADPSSMQSLYRAALALRRAAGSFGDEGLEWLPAPDG